MTLVLFHRKNSVSKLTAIAEFSRL